MPNWNYGNIFGNQEPLPAEAPPGGFYQVDQQGDWGNAQQVHINPEDLNAYIKEQNEAMKVSKKYATGLSSGRSVSLSSDEYQALTLQIKECQGSCRQEQEELERAITDISRLVEVVQDIGSQVRRRITSLQTVATQLEMWRQTLPQPSSPDSETKPVASHSPPAPTPPIAGAGLKQVAPGLWQQGQG